MLLGPSTVNASQGFSWPSSNVPLELELTAGESLYGAAVASVMVTVLRSRT